MSNASPAYKLDNSKSSSSKKHAPDVRVVRGNRSGQSTMLHYSTKSIIKIVIAILLSMLVVGFIRIGLVSATVSTSLKNGSISSQIEELKASSSDLEVKQSSLTNPDVIKQRALSMGMSAPEQTQVVTLPADAVATNDKGELSLSAGMAVAAQQQG